MLDTIKHLDHINPDKFPGPILIIGVGALGSAVALEIAKLGFQDITLMDDDEIVPHNLSNQILYGPSAVGLQKIEVAQIALRLLTGVEAKIIQGRAGRTKLRYRFIFCCVDSMAARQEIFTKAVMWNFHSDTYIEGRMSAKTGRAYILDPSDHVQNEQYNSPDILHPDHEVPPEIGKCGVTPSIGATAHILAGIMTWMFIAKLHDNGKVGEVTFSTDPWNMQFYPFIKTA